MDNTKPHPNYRLFIVIIAMLAIGVWLTAVSLYKQKQEREEIPAVPISPGTGQQSTVPTVSIINKGLMLAKSNTTSAQVGQSIVFTPTFNSEGKDVIGYDILVKYDPEALTYSGATSLLPSFSVVPVVSDGLVSITGYKPPEVKTETVFKDSSVVRIVFTAKTKGKHTISVVPTSGNQTSKFIDPDLNRLHPRTSAVDVVVE